MVATVDQIMVEATAASEGDFALAAIATAQLVMDETENAFTIVEELQHLTEVCLIRCSETGGLPIDFSADNLSVEKMTSASNFVDLIMHNQIDIEGFAYDLKRQCRLIHNLTKAAKHLAELSDTQSNPTREDNT